MFDPDKVQWIRVLSLTAENLMNSFRKSTLGHEWLCAQMWRQFFFSKGLNQYVNDMMWYTCKLNSDRGVSVWRFGGVFSKLAPLQTGLVTLAAH